MHALASRGRQPLAAKVPEITFLFWVIKLLTTAGGEAASDYLALRGDAVAGAVEIILVVVAVWVQFRTRRYVAAAYWFLALAIAVFGTGVSDALHLVVGIPYAGTTLLWAVVLAAVFWRWHRSEGTLSIHSITTRRREMYYWATVFATFALGTALGDFTASAMGLGYLSSGIAFAVIIAIPAVAWRLGLNSVVAFWFAYVVTRPLGASFADYASKPHAISGLRQRSAGGRGTGAVRDRCERGPSGAGVRLLAGRQGQLRRRPGGGRRVVAAMPSMAPRRGPAGRSWPRRSTIWPPRRHPPVPGHRHRPADREQHPRGRPAGRAGLADRLRGQRPDRARPRPGPADQRRPRRHRLHRRRPARPGTILAEAAQPAGLQPAGRAHAAARPALHPGRPTTPTTSWPS